MVAQAPGVVNLLENHPIETAAVQANVPLGFWCIKDFYAPEQLRWLKELSMKVFRDNGVTLHKAHSPKTGGTYYKTLAASRSPCTCKYSYAGFNADKKDSNYLQWMDTYDPHQGPEPEHNTLFRSLLEPFQRKMGIPVEMCPDLVVGNLYGDPTNYIGEHTDSDPLFDTRSGESVIVSINLAMDGLFYGRLCHERAQLSAEAGEKNALS